MRPPWEQGRSYTVFWNPQQQLPSRCLVNTDDLMKSRGVFRDWGRMVRVPEVYRELLSCILRNKDRNILLVLGHHWQRSDKETKQSFLGLLKGSSQCPQHVIFLSKLGNFIKPRSPAFLVWINASSGQLSFPFNIKTLLLTVLSLWVPFLWGSVCGRG